MKVLIIFPSSGEEIIDVIKVKREPLGACYIAASLIKAGHKSKVLHQIHMNNSDVIKYLSNYKPDIVGFSTMTYNTRFHLADIIK